MKSMLMALAAVAVLTPAVHAQEVRVTVTDVQHRSGHIQAVLYTEANFLRGAGVYQVAAAPPANPGTVTLVFPDVAPGTYALSVMHDEDDDRRMRRTEAGALAEGWAFSNGGSLMGPPTFATTSFAVTAAAPVALSVNLFYPYVPSAP